jgi:hypothetical protein
VTTKTTTKKTVKKTVKKEEHFLKVTFSDQGVDIQGQNVSRVNHIEAILALIYSLHTNDPEMDTVKTCINAIESYRNDLKNKSKMITQLEHLRDLLQEARKKAEAKVKAQKKTTKKK